MRISARMAYAAFLPFHLSACGEADDPVVSRTPYDTDETVVIGDPEGPKTVATPDGDDCAQVGAACVTPQDECGDQGTADVIVDANGNVLDVICYGQEVTVDEIPIDQVDSVTAGNNTVVVLDGEDDGLDVTGDLIVEGNNAIVYGEGPDTSVIGGDLILEKNNAIVRGVRVQGDVVIDKNNTKMVFCVIEGDLTIAENNTTIAECDVYGTVTVSHNNTVLVSNRFNGTDTIRGKSNTECSGNIRFDDANEDFAIQDEELGGPVTCE